MAEALPQQPLCSKAAGLLTCSTHPAAGPPRGQHQHNAPKQQQQQVLGSSQSDTITIKGSSKQAISSARVRTQLLIDSVISSRMLDYTHFVSIPLANKETAAKLQEFQQQVPIGYRGTACACAVVLGYTPALLPR